MKIKKLNKKGIAHIFLPMLAVLIVATAGTYMIVKSSAMSDAAYRSSEKRIRHSPAGSRKRIVLMAKQQLGYAEQPVNKVKFFEWAGDRPNAPGPWCSVFATWVWHAAGVRLDGTPYPLQDAVRVVKDRGVQDGRFHAVNPQAGDAVIYGPRGDDHIGIVEKVTAKNIYIIEGNSHLKGTEDKYVIRRKIKLKKPKPATIPHGVIYGYVSPPSR